MAQSVKHATLDCGVINSSPTLDIEFIRKKKKEKDYALENASFLVLISSVLWGDNLHTMRRTLFFLRFLFYFYFWRERERES